MEKAILYLGLFFKLYFFIIFWKVPKIIYKRSVGHLGEENDDGEELLGGF